MGETYIDDEAKAYNTPNGGHSRSNRKGIVRFADGKLRTVRLGVPDTFFTIPAHATVNGKYASGFVSVNTETEEFEFTQYV